MAEMAEEVLVRVFELPGIPGERDVGTVFISLLFSQRGDLSTIWLIQFHERQLFQGKIEVEIRKKFFLL